MPNPTPTPQPEISLLLTDAPTEPGQAAVVEDGRPIYLVDGERLPVDYPDLRSRLGAANLEAQQRREALGAISKALGLEVDVRTSDGLGAVTSAITSYGAEMQELAELRAMREAGQLDEDADAKIRQAAATMRQEEFDKLTKEVADWKKSAAELKAGKERVAGELRATNTVTALRDFYDKHQDLFREASLETFLTVAQHPSPDGYAWRPTGEVNASGIPTVALTNEDGTLKMGPDGVTPMSFKTWADTQLRASNPVLFKPVEGSPDNVEPGGGGARATHAGDMSREEIDRAARRTYQNAGGQQTAAA